MDDQYLNKFRSIIRAEIDIALEIALKPIKQTLEVHGKKLDEHSQKLDEHGQKLDELGSTQNEHTGKIDALIAEVSVMHQEIGGLRDQTKLYYENNKRNINQIRQKLGMPKSPSLTEAADYPS